MNLQNLQSVWLSVVREWLDDPTDHTGLENAVAFLKDPAHSAALHKFVAQIVDGTSSTISAELADFQADGGCLETEVFLEITITPKTAGHLPNEDDLTNRITETTKEFSGAYLDDLEIGQGCFYLAYVSVAKASDVGPLMDSLSGMLFDLDVELACKTDDAEAEVSDAD